MKRIVVGISGATGAPLAVRVLEFLRDLDVEVHLIVSQWARATLLHECGIRAKDLTRYAHQMHDASDQAATISSGSFHTDGMIIVPCSRCHPQRATTAGLGPTGDPAEPDPSRKPPGAFAHWHNHFPTNTRFLPSAGLHRRRGRSPGGPHPRSVWARSLRCPSLGRNESR